jgi:hypothetical protein
VSPGGDPQPQMPPPVTRDSYYGQPIIKAPVWTPEIPTYFFLGGMAGAAAPMAVAAGLRGNERLERRAWLLAMTGLVAAPPLLIRDLGRPERFHHMLRVFKLTSPMSVGSWLLTATAGAVALGTARDAFGLFPRLGRLGAAAAVLGPLLSTYTAVLIADTAVPVWHEARRELPFVFAAGSAASAGGALALLTPAQDAGPARRLAMIGAVAELAATTAMERRLGELGEPYQQGETGRFATAAKVLVAAGGAAMALAGRRRAGAAVGGALLLAGALSERWAVYRAGPDSARDPKYTVGLQRRRKAQRERDGASAGQAA